MADQGKKQYCHHGRGCQQGLKKGFDFEFNENEDAQGSGYYRRRCGVLNRPRRDVPNEIHDPEIQHRATGGCQEQKAIQNKQGGLEPCALDFVKHKGDRCTHTKRQNQTFQPDQYIAENHVLSLLLFAYKKQ
ncbi:hypothetical protein [Desulfatibacillum alkenivorans]|uniref:hypothetical protein n=1 Tax=Desulfatibacillum alkenivorans TaxID=259354 RepID=UPI001114C5CE|nr:hypothetical protein [Desulfatibacillum alkenivorans]